MSPNWQNELSILFIYYSTPDQSHSLPNEEPGSLGIPLPRVNTTTLRLITQWFNILRAPDRNYCSQSGVSSAMHFFSLIGPIVPLVVLMHCDFFIPIHFPPAHHFPPPVHIKA